MKALQTAEAAASTPERNWGEVEARARAALEAFAHADGEDRKEALAATHETLREAAPNAVDSEGFALLHYAAMYGCTEAISSLITRRASVNVRTKVHESPLQLAAYYRHAEACALLLAHRARADLADWQGRTPLAAAKESRCGNGPDNNGQAQARCVELLAEREAREATWREGGPAASKEEEASAAAAAAGALEAANLRSQGNGFFKQGRHNDAVASYSLALSFFDDPVLYSNRAECYLKLQKPLEAKLDAQKAAGLAKAASSAVGLKASWRLGRACLALGEVGKAAEVTGEALKSWPGDKALLQLATDAERERRRRLTGED